MIKKPIVLIAALCVMFAATAFVLDEQEKMLPSEANQKIYQIVTEKLKAFPTSEEAEMRPKIQAEVLAEMMPKIKTECISMDEKYNLANMLGESKEALALFKEVADSDSKNATFAAMMYFRIYAKDETVSLDKFRAEAEGYVKKIPASPRNAYIVNSLKTYVFQKMLDGGDADAALEYTNSEIVGLDINSQDSGWSSVPVWYIKAYDAKGDRDKGIKLAKSYAVKMNKKAEELKASGENADLLAFFERSAKALTTTINGETLIGSVAPGFEFTNFYNSEAFKFEDLKGKVIVLDFFANWCGPCIGTFPHMREFYSEYTPKGVKIIGVTGFQGSMVNHGSERVTDISVEEEEKLMHTFIKHQNVTWPVAFSTRNCYDPEYGVRGVPTMVIIDKKGVVRMSTHPYYQKKVREMVDKLLAE